MLNRQLIHLCASVGIGALILGCATEPKQPSSLAERQDAVLKDPYGYKPNMDQNTDISGGGVFDFDKDAFRKDMNSVLNP